MPRLLIAKADGKRWKEDTIIDVFPDGPMGDMEKNNLYEIVKVGGTIEEARTELRKRITDIGDIGQPSPYAKKLSSSKLTIQDKTSLGDTRLAVRALAFAKTEKIAALEPVVIER